MDKGNESENVAKQLTAEEFQRLARGDDPNRPPMWNGAPRITTPPASPVRPMADDGQLFEFLFPYPIHIFDSSEWPPLKILREDTEFYLLKPLTTAVTPREQVAAGNEIPDLYCSTVRVIVLEASRGFPATHKKAFEVARDALQWIRILSRQYWIGSGAAGVSATYRASAFRVDGAVVGQRNCVFYGSAALVRALPRSAWEPLGLCVEQSIPVPVSESIFCDALSSLAQGDTVRCLVELGISIEIELTNLLDDVAALNPSSADATKYLKRRQYESFENRFLQYSTRLGCKYPRDFTAPNASSDWFDKIVLLYKFRNKAAHEGRPVLYDDSVGRIRSLAEGELQSFVFSAETFFQWSSEQRSRFVLPNPAPSVNRSKQLVAVIGEPTKGQGLALETSESLTQN